MSVIFIKESMKVVCQFSLVIMLQETLLTTAWILMQVIRIFTSLAIPSGSSNRFAYWPMYARAVHSFHHKPWFSSVVVQMEASGQDEVTSYEQIRLLFKVNVISEGGEKLCKELVFLRMYREVLANHLSRLVGCPELVWQSLPTAYVVFEVANILRAIHVVPNLSKVGHFFLNKYKI
jgi:hypothetical protein